MKNKVRSAEQVKLTNATTEDMPGGTPVKSGVYLVVPIATIEVGKTGSAERTGVFNTMPKAAGEAWVQGDALYWNNTNKNFTKTAAGASLAGAAEEAADSADTVGTVLLPGLLLV